MEYLHEERNASSVTYKLYMLSFHIQPIYVVYNFSIADLSIENLMYLTAVHTIILFCISPKLHV